MSLIDTTILNGCLMVVSRPKYVVGFSICTVVLAAILNGHKGNGSVNLFREPLKTATTITLRQLSPHRILDIALAAFRPLS